jgi:hypothetical protein
VLRCREFYEAKNYKPLRQKIIKLVTVCYELQSTALFNSVRYDEKEVEQWIKKI